MPKRHIETVVRQRVRKPSLKVHDRKRISEIPTPNHWVLKEVLSRKEKARFWRLLRVDEVPLRFDTLEQANEFILNEAKKEVKSKGKRYLLVYTKTLPIAKRVYMRVDFGGVTSYLTKREYSTHYEEAVKEAPLAPKKKRAPKAVVRQAKRETTKVFQAEKAVVPAKQPAPKPPLLPSGEKKPVYRSYEGVPTVQFKNLSMSFVDPVTGYRKNVIRNVTLNVYSGETLGLIGESGSGKTVLTSLLTGILPENAVVDSGQILIDGIDVTNWNQKAWQESKFRGQVVGQVFQNPLTTLNPVMKIGEQMIEALIYNKLSPSAQAAFETSVDFLTRMKISRPRAVMDMYPHQLSGGMRQRVVIGCILSLKPTVVILDEPTTALDTTVQAEILDIVNEIKQEFDVTFIYITHDIGVIASIADKIAIMYAGSIVEFGLTREILLNARHPYTWGLLLSMPEVNDAKRLWSIPGSVPADITNIKGDVFAPRNPYALAVDFVSVSPLYKVSETHYAATRLLDTKAPNFDPPAPIKRK